MSIRTTPAAVLTFVALTSMTTASGQGQPDRNSVPDTPGTGPFAPLKEVDPGLPGHVVYRPADMDDLGDNKLGLYVFGNGGCSADGASSRLHLLNVASHGYLAIAPGGIHNGPGRTNAPPRPEGTDLETFQPTTPAQLTAAIDWALAENERRRSPYFGRIDPEQIAISGYSCGGVQALTIAGDPRVKTVVIMNSGLFVDGETRMAGIVETKSRLQDLHTPTIYILGGATDIAYENGMDDYRLIDHVPIAVANIDKGHGGTYWEPDGGAAADVVVSWLGWQLRGRANDAARFVGTDCGLCADPEWSYASKGLSADGFSAPELEFVFEELVTLGPAVPAGTTPYGDRNIIPITGGTFRGPKIAGKILPGGWDWQLATAGGCRRIEADYMIQADDGTIINVVNTGRFCRRSDGEPGGGFTTPAFEAPIGKHDWLNGGAFVGTLEGAEVDGEPAVRIRFFMAK